MVKFKNGLKRFLAVALVTSLCGAMPMVNAYAQTPSGPASDVHIVENTSKGTGPGAENQPEQPTVQPEQPTVQPEQPTVQPEQPTTQPEQPTEPAVEPETQENVQETTDGRVMRGGRLLDPLKPMIALTFDDGPYAPVDNRIMDSLEQHNGRATFFVVGNRVAQYKTEIKRMQDNGHEVGNHTYDHKNLTKLSAADIRSQIARCNEAVAAVTGVTPTLVRTPGGSINSTVRSNVSVPIIMWSIDTLDWKTKNAQKTINSVIGKVQDGDIVLMHELYPATADAAATIISKLTEQGYQLVTVSEMAEFRGGMAGGKEYNKLRP